jgi:hypothetical protein
MGWVGIGSRVGSLFLWFVQSYVSFAAQAYVAYTASVINAFPQKQTDVETTHCAARRSPRMSNICRSMSDVNTKLWYTACFIQLVFSLHPLKKHVP